MSPHERMDLTGSSSDEGGPSRWVGALAAIGAGTVLWSLHRLTAPEPTDVFPERLSHQIGSEDPIGRARTLATNLNAPLLGGNQIELLENGDEIFPPMLEAIENAERSVNLLTFVYWTGDIARTFAETLARAAHRGVEVRVLLDAFGAAKMHDDLVDLLEAAGCTVAWFHGVRWYKLRRVNNRTHRKVLVVDGKVGFTGGVGIAEEWTGDAQDEDHWRDDHFRLEGPVVRYLQGAFGENWRESTGEALAGPALFPKLGQAGASPIVPILGQPGGSVSRVGFTYWLSLRSASRSIRLVTPYFSPDGSLHDLLVSTARRGVDVEILLPSHYIDKRSARWIAKAHYSSLLEAGCRIFEYQPTMMHTKVLIVDGEWAVVGSANFDNRSFDLNYEIVLAIADAEFAAELEESIEGDLARAEEVVRDDVKGWSLPQRARNRLAVAFREQV